MAEELKGFYNTTHGIERYLTNLDDLHKLMQERQEAAYRDERLDEFIILGRWYADSRGNFGRCTFDLDYEPTDLSAQLPAVLRKEDAFRILPKLGIKANADPAIPRSHLRCSVRNAKFIDLSPHPEYKDNVVNEKGWRFRSPAHKNERLKLDYIAEEGDECSITVFSYLHKRCFALRKARLERESFTEIFAKAGMPNAVLNEIPNGYCPCERCAPWFIARLPFGDITIGWRKRVINIDWSATKRDLSKLFDGEKVTKEAYLVHAWGEEKAIDYLSRLRGALA